MCIDRFMAVLLTCLTWRSPCFFLWLTDHKQWIIHPHDLQFHYLFLVYMLGWLVLPVNERHLVIHTFQKVEGFLPTWEFLMTDANYKLRNYKATCTINNTFRKWLNSNKWCFCKAWRLFKEVMTPLIPTQSQKILLLRLQWHCNNNTFKIEPLQKLAHIEDSYLVLVS